MIRSRGWDCSADFVTASPAPSSSSSSASRRSSGARTRPSARTRAIDVETLDALEEVLISRRRRASRHRAHRVGGQGARAPRREPARPGEAGDPRRVRRRRETRGSRPLPAAATPRVVLIVGVNGTGQDDDGRQARQPAEGVGGRAAGLRGGHVPGGRRGAARDLGDARRRRHRAGEGRRRSGGGRVRRHLVGQGPGRGRRSWSTRPAASTRAST